MVALSAALAELVVVAAAGNQWVVDHLVHNAKPSELPRNRELKAALTSFPWRWTPEHHQRMLWLGEVVAAVGLVVVLFLLMLAFVGPMRAPRRFVAVFLGAWGIVVALTQIAAIGQTVLAYSDLDKSAVDPDRLIFEAPQRAQQVWLLKRFGSDCNLGNIAPNDVLSLETLRLGLRSETVDRFALGDRGSGDD